MKPNELRLGNFTEFHIYDMGEDYWIFNEVEFSDLNLHDMNDIRPIALTEEWLLKLGFEKGLHTFHLNLKDQFIEYKDGEVFLGGEDSCISGMCFVSKIKYVHQLQNLYFALTGEELEVKETATN